jgi:hypothetical protein
MANLGKVKEEKDIKQEARFHPQSPKVWGWERELLSVFCLAGRPGVTLAVERGPVAVWRDLKDSVPSSASPRRHVLTGGGWKPFSKHHRPQGMRR